MSDCQLRSWTCFFCFSRENESVDYDENFFLCNINVQCLINVITIHAQLHCNIVTQNICLAQIRPKYCQWTYNTYRDFLKTNFIIQGTPKWIEVNVNHLILSKPYKLWMNLCEQFHCNLSIQGFWKNCNTCNRKIPQKKLTKREDA